MDYDHSYLDFIARHHPKYYSDDRVLTCDVLFRYISGDDVGDDDLAWLRKYTKEEALQELIRLETLLFSETLHYHHKQILQQGNDNRKQRTEKQTGQRTQ